MPKEKKLPPKKYQEKLQPMSRSTRQYAVGRGLVGLGQNELNRRMKQHREISRAALKKGDAAMNIVKNMEKVVGMHGSPYGGDVSGLVQQRNTSLAYSQAQYKKAKLFQKKFDTFKALSRFDK
tara:strand:+ start:3168 stop:3536 length:369 start_codon:yes stop_codon:yes gene_type:complete